MQEKKDNKRFGYVSTYDTKPKRRLYDMLINQGMQIVYSYPSGSLIPND